MKTLNSQLSTLNCVVVMLLLCATPLMAQEQPPVDKPAREGPANNKNKTFEVAPGQLKPGDIPPRPETSDPKDNKNQKLTLAGRPARTKAEVEEMYKQIATGYRSLCCPHKNLVDADCNWGAPQQRNMLRFLIAMGYDSKEIDGYMVNGGPKDLREAYRTWLRREAGVTDKDVLDFHFVMPNIGNDAPEHERKYVGHGYDKGWGEMLHEAPRDAGLYVLLGLAGLAILIAFIYAIRKITGKAAAAPAQSASASGTPSAPNAAVDARIADDIKRMEKDES